MIPELDLAAIQTALAPYWAGLDGARIFFTGGTGFIGRWMLEALARAPIDVRVTILTRDPAAFAARASHLTARFEFIAGDVLNFRQPSARFTDVIHGATDASAALTQSDPRRMFDTIITGTRAALDLAQRDGARFTLMSSGGIYGQQPWDMPHIPEQWTGAPDPCDPRSAYNNGKRAAEALTNIYRHQFGLDTRIARIFALLGPGLSLDTHFAAGNFIRDAIAGRRITITGSGQAVRSYLYAADLAIWMWRLHLSAAPGSTYNIGSDQAVSILDLARRTAILLGGPGVDVLGQPDPGWNPGRYVPSTEAIRTDLGLAPTVDLDESIRRTAAANGYQV